jgi:hypothetical protein
MKPKILILTDSVSLPRESENDLTTWEDSYVYRIRQHFSEYEVVNLSFGGATISDLRSQVNYYKVLNPTIVIFQSGVVDAAPRAFGKLEMEIIKKLRLFRFTKPFVKWLRKNRGINYTEITTFEKVLKEIIQVLNPKVFFAIGILPSCDAYESVAPGISRNIDLYNGVLKRNTHFIDMQNIPRNGILNDHHHINAVGQDYIFEKLVNQISSIKKNIG